MLVEPILAAGDIVGESAVWDTRDARLLWVDIIGRRIHAFAPASGRHEVWRTPDRVTSIGLRRDGGAIVGLTRTLALWDFDEIFDTFAAVEPDLPGNRLNEGVVGPDGAFWIGTMQNNIAPDGSPQNVEESTGRLYRCTADGRVHALSDDRFGITNTLVWTPDGDLITADTLANEIYRYRYDPATRRLSDRRPFHRGFGRGAPDGSAIDADGFVWNCRVAGGGCVVRFDPEGAIDRVVDLPCSWPTSCAFGGPGLDTLFVTSARFTMDAGHIAENPQEGGLFAVRPGVTGLACNRFG